jgi:hypothetical protein
MVTLLLVVGGYMPVLQHVLWQGAAQRSTLPPVTMQANYGP